MSRLISKARGFCIYEKSGAHFFRNGVLKRKWPFYPIIHMFLECLIFLLFIPHVPGEKWVKVDPRFCPDECHGNCERPTNSVFPRRCLNGTVEENMLFLHHAFPFGNFMLNYPKLVPLGQSRSPLVLRSIICVLWAAFVSFDEAFLLPKLEIGVGFISGPQSLVKLKIERSSPSKIFKLC